MNEMAPGWGDYNDLHKRLNELEQAVKTLQRAVLVLMGERDPKDEPTGDAA